MLKIAKLTLAIAAAALAVPATAGNSWPQGPSGKTQAAAPASATLAQEKSEGAAAAGGFTYSSEGVGWEPSQHKYVMTRSGLVHSQECDHAIRTAEAVTPQAVEEARKQWPGG